jgi:hypothetical protein
VGYFLERGMTRDFSFRQTKPGIEASVEPRMAHCTDKEQRENEHP